MSYMVIAKRKIKGKNDTTVGYEISYICHGNNPNASDSEGSAKVSNQQIKDLILNKKVYFMNLQIDKTGRLVKKAINPNDLITLGETWSNVAQETVILYAHDHEKEAIEVIKKYYQDEVKEGHTSGIFKQDCQWMVKLVKNADFDFYYNYDTQGRERFQNVMIEKLLKIKDITPYWQLPDRGETSNNKPAEKMEVKNMLDEFINKHIKNNVFSLTKLDSDENYEELLDDDLYGLIKGEYGEVDGYWVSEYMDALLSYCTEKGLLCADYEYSLDYESYIISDNFKDFVNRCYDTLNDNQIYPNEDEYKALMEGIKEFIIRMKYDESVREFMKKVLILGWFANQEWFIYSEKWFNAKAAKYVAAYINKSIEEHPSFKTMLSKSKSVEISMNCIVGIDYYHKYHKKDFKFIYDNNLWHCESDSNSSITSLASDKTEDRANLYEANVKINGKSAKLVDILMKISEKQ